MEFDDGSYEKARFELFYSKRERVGELAYRAQLRGEAARDVLIVLIDVAADEWASVIENVGAGHVLSQPDNVKQNQIVLATALLDSISDDLIQKEPKLESRFQNLIPDGHYRVAVLGENGASLYFIKPFPKPQGF